MSASQSCDATLIQTSPYVGCNIVYALPPTLGNLTQSWDLDIATVVSYKEISGTYKSGRKPKLQSARLPIRQRAALFNCAAWFSCSIKTWFQ